MNKNLIALVILSVVSLGVKAQGYYHFKTKGTTSNYNMHQSTGTTVILAGTDIAQANFLSSSQNLPFSFNFYGTPVTQFKASSSGYITFDLSQTTDVSNNIALPNTSAPRNAIFAFWDNLRLQSVTVGANPFSSDIRSWTIGASPNRVFVIQWRLAQTNDNSNITNVTYFAIRIYENSNNFDIVHNYGFGNFSATVGCQNNDASNGYQLGSSPNQNFGGTNGYYDETQSDVYTFYYGTQAAIDMRLVSDLTTDIVSANNTIGIPVSVQVSNYGSDSILTGTFNYSVNGGTPVSTTFNSNLSPSGGNDALSSTTNFVANASDAGTFKNIQIWITNINGSSIGSDTLNTTIFVNKGTSGSKRVLVEEGSGAWCGYCPDGHYRLSEILNGANGNKIVGVVHHDDDGMANPNSDIINAAYGNFFPYGLVDRYTFSDQSSTELDRDFWVTKITERLNTPTPVNVNIVDRTYDAATRKVSFKVQANFVDFLTGDIRLNAYIVENNVRGPKISSTNTAWNQRNYFAEGDETNSPILPTLPPYIVGYKHQHTVRSIPSGAWGTASVIPSVVAENSVYSRSYTYTIPAETSVNYDAEDGNLNEELRNTISGAAMNKHYDMYIVGFVSIYNADLKKHEVLNVIEVPLAWNVGLSENTTSQTMPATLYPNPTNGLTSVSFTTSSTGNVEITLVDITGKKVMDINNSSYAKGEHTFYFDVTSLKNGVYFVSIKGDNETANKRLVIAK